MAKYAVVNAQNVVDNIIEWDGVTPFSVPNHTLQRSDTETIGLPFGTPPPGPTATDDANAARLTTFATDPDRIDTLDRLRTATAAQIDTFVDNNVTDIVTARRMFKRILKLLALMSPR
jgi:hypothetical protein